MAVTPCPAATPGWSALADTVFLNYDGKLGLPPLLPTALAQDGAGFLWIGTQGGMLRWDGYAFRPFDVMPKSLGEGGAQGQASSWIDVLHTDPRGRLWVGTNADGLFRYDDDLGRFVAIPLGAGGSPHWHIGALADDGAGGLWVGTDEGLIRLGADSHVLASLHHDPHDTASLPDGGVRALLRDADGRLWVGAGGGLARLDMASLALAHGPFAPLPFGGADGAHAVTALYQDADGHIWIGTAQQGIFTLGARAAQPLPMTVPGVPEAELRSLHVSAISAAGAHHVWVGTRATGILDIDTAAWRAVQIRHDPWLAGSLAHDDVWAMLRDKAGSIWVGGAGGLSVHARDAGIITPILGQSSRGNGMSQPDPSAVLSAKDGRLWVGFLDGGANVLDPVQGRVAALRADPLHPDDALPRDVVTEMAEADDGSVFIGTARGLYHADPSGRTVSLVQVPQRDPHGFVRAVRIDRGILWIGGRDDGLWGVPLAPAAAAVFGPVQSRGLTDRAVFDILPGPANDLWVGTAHGLNHIDLATHRVSETILPDPGKADALPGGIISTLLFDRLGRLWVGNFGYGLAVMLGRDAQGARHFRRLGVAEGLPHANIDKLLLDGEGDVWVSTDDGLAMIDPADLHISTVSKPEGPALSAYWVKSGATDSAGYPVFGAKGGLAVVRPGRPAPWTIAPPIVVSDIQVGGRAMPGSQFNGAGRHQPIVLEPQGNSVVVAFSALDFTAPSRNRYAFRLEGFDTRWTEATSWGRLAAYTNLPPGTYTLRLRGSNRDGLWVDRTLDIPIHVLPTWYQTWWFACVLAILPFCAVAAFIRSRTAYLRRRQRELEELVANRTADLQAANKKLFDLASVDPLTGCASRRHFVEQAQEVIASHDGARLSLIIADLDHFKHINDTHGHPAGDDVLRAVGAMCKSAIGAPDLVGRMGGEEFAALIRDTGEEASHAFAERLRARIGGAALPTGAGTLRVTVSMGLARLVPGESFDDLYCRADAALYRAKKRGRDCVVSDADVVLTDERPGALPPILQGGDPAGA